MESFALRTPLESARPRPQLGVREKCPGLANLRDHGLTCDAELLRLVENLQCQRGGYALVSEASLRAMFWQDTGHMPGVGTLPTAMRRIEERTGLLMVRWIHKGSIAPNGKLAKVGMLAIRRARDRHDRRAIRRRAVGLDRRADFGSSVAPAVENFHDLKQELEQREAEHRAREERVARSRSEARAAAEEFRALYGPGFRALYGPGP